MSSRDILAAIVEASDDAIMGKDMNGTITSWNKGAEKIFGYTADEMLGASIMRLIPSDRPEEENQIMAKIKRGESVDNFETRRQTKSGRLINVSITICPIKDAAGQVIGVSKVARDITVVRKLETQLLQSQKLESIGQLAGGVAHDFNNILAAMMMQTELALAVDQTPAAVREGLQQLRIDIDRASDLTRQLLLFSRKQVMQNRTLDLNEVVASLVKMLQRTIREDVRLDLHLGSAPLIVNADANMLDQLLMNLAVNARDAMPNGGRLLIETSEKLIDVEQMKVNPEASLGRYVCLSISDNGCGIPPEVLPHIFEPFFTTKEAGKGTGLGLATVFGIVKQHHGWIRVYSEIGNGTTFQVFLPAAAASATEDSAGAQPKPKPRGGTETILLAEDNEVLRKLTRMVLQKNGYTVLDVADGVAAGEVWNQEQGRIDLLLTDLVMPGGVNGHDLAARLCGEKPGLKVLFTSGYSAEIAGRELALRAGQNFIQKPCPPGQLLEAIRNCLDS